MLANHVEQVVDCKVFKSLSCDEHREGKQSIFFLAAQKWKSITSSPMHDVVMNVAHMVRDVVQIHKNQDITMATMIRNFVPRITKSIMTLRRVGLPHEIVP